MTTAALIYLAITVLGLGAVLTNHGEPRTGEHSFAWSLVAKAITCGLLYWGGFFSSQA